MRPFGSRRLAKADRKCRLDGDHPATTGNDYSFISYRRKIGFLVSRFLVIERLVTTFQAHSGVGRQEESEICRFPSCSLGSPFAFWLLLVAAVPPRKQLLRKARRLLLRPSR